MSEIDQSVKVCVCMCVSIIILVRVIIVIVRARRVSGGRSGGAVHVGLLVHSCGSHRHRRRAPGYSRRWVYADSGRCLVRGHRVMRHSRRVMMVVGVMMRRVRIVPQLLLRGGGSLQLRHADRLSLVLLVL